LSGIAIWHEARDNINFTPPLAKRQATIGAAGKHIVFGIYQSNGKMLAFPITNRGKKELVL
jgi:hypothetical protein